MSNEQLSTKIELQNQSIKHIMEQFEKSQEENKEQHTAIMKSQLDFHKETKETLKELTEKLDMALDKKAGKWVEDAIKWFLYAVASILVSSFMYLVLKTKI